MFISRSKKLLIIAEPLNSSTSVQQKFIMDIGRALSSEMEVTVATLEGSERVEAAFRQNGIELVYPKDSPYLLNKFLKEIGRSNESTVWGEAWVLEAFTSRNSYTMSRLIDSARFDYIINTTNTIAIDCDIWWIQGVSPADSLIRMNTGSRFRDTAMKILGGGLRVRDYALLSRMARKCMKMIANSSYVKDYYTQLGFSISDILYSFPDTSKFRPTIMPEHKKYILSYIGKETELGTLLKLSGQGLKVLSFGGKALYRPREWQFRHGMEFLGRVDQNELVRLYSNALFTVFPFTDEPLGWIPIESMACGTPVLTYNKQGPKETVVNGQTGWLVDDAEAMMERATNLWEDGFDRSRFSRNAIERAREFSPLKQAIKLMSILN